MDYRRVIRRIALFSMKKYRLHIPIIKNRIFKCVLCSFLWIIATGCQSERNYPNLNQEMAFIDTLHKGLSYTRSIDPYEPTPIVMDHSAHTMSIAVVGDIMFHNTQLTRAYKNEENEFDFSNIFVFMKPYLIEPDLLFGNLETTLNGPYGDVNSFSDTNVHGYSGYPTFNSPDTVLDAIVDAGFDFLSTANNHALDKSVKGMNRTIEQLDLKGIRHTGTFSEEVIHKPYERIEKNGFSFAIVNYTYATNGIQLSNENMQRINTLDNYNQDSIEKLYSDVREANASDVDYVIVMMHFGNEYQEYENKVYQQKITEALLVNGADIVFGGHPHVLQPIRIYNEVNGVTFDHPKLVIYSLGNFIASQHNVEKIGGNTDLGVVFKVFLKKVDDQEPSITGIGFLPTYTLWQQDIIMTIPINKDYNWTDGSYNYNQDDNTKHIYVNDWDKRRIEFGKAYILEHLMTYEANNEALSSPYIKDGFICYDFYLGNK